MDPEAQFYSVFPRNNDLYPYIVNYLFHGCSTDPMPFHSAWNICYNP